MLFWGAVALVGFLMTLTIGRWGILIFVLVAAALATIFFDESLGFSVLFFLIGLPVGLAGAVFGLIARYVIVSKIAGQ